MTNEEKRKERIRMIWNLIKKSGNASETKLTAEFSCQTGISERVIKDYIKMLVNSQRVRKEGDNLCLTETTSKE